MSTQDWLLAQLTGRATQYYRRLGMLLPQQEVHLYLHDSVVRNGSFSLFITMPEQPHGRPQTIVIAGTSAGQVLQQAYQRFGSDP